MIYHVNDFIKNGQGEGLIRDKLIISVKDLNKHLPIMCERTLKTKLKKLSDLGVLNIERQFGKNKGSLPNIYSFI